MSSPQTIRTALAGNPNCGKTTLFNALTGAHQHVGNYPGVTVEKRQGHYKLDGTRVEVLDLPGTYSLSSYSPEERIAQDELLKGDVDVVVVVVDSTALKRSLVLLAQLIQLGVKPVLCLNMADEAERAGQKLNLEQLRRLLGIPVVETVGHKGRGVDALRSAIQEAAGGTSANERLVLGDRLEGAIAAVKGAMNGAAPGDGTDNWVATKLLLDDHLFVERLSRDGDNGQAVLAEAARQRRKIEEDTRIDIALFVMESYYGFVDGLLREVQERAPRTDARALSDRIDQVLAHRLLGIPFFLTVMYLVFWLTFTVGELPMGWIEAGFGALGSWLSGLWPEGSTSPLRSLLVDGVIGGVGGVLVFLPNIVLLFLCLVFLEDTGYMARAAFLTDRVMHRFGLHGRSFVPMMTGFGCSVPGIMATRTLENERDRLTTMLVLPLMSCGARLPIWMLLIPAFFPPMWRAPILWLIYTVGIGLALGLALLLRRTLLKGDEAPFVMELPPYRMPTLRSVLSRMIERAWAYLRKAGTVILGISILMWAVASYPTKSSYDVDAEVAAGAALSAETVESRRAEENLRYSLAGRIGHAMEPVIRPLGFDWRIGTGLVGAFAAKEVFVAQMGIIYALGEADEGSQELRGALARDYSPLTGFCLMLFLLIATPCMATFAVTRRESGSWRWALLQFGGLTVVAYLLTMVVNQVGRLLA